MDLSRRQLVTGLATVAALPAVALPSLAETPTSVTDQLKARLMSGEIIKDETFVLDKTLEIQGDDLKLGGKMVDCTLIVKPSFKGYIATFRGSIPAIDGSIRLIRLPAPDQIVGHELPSFPKSRYAPGHIQLQNN